MRTQKDPEKVQTLVRTFVGTIANAVVSIQPPMIAFVYQNFVEPELESREMPEDDLWFVQVIINPPDEVEVRLNEQARLQGQDALTGETLFDSDKDNVTHQAMTDIWNQILAGNKTVTFLPKVGKIERDKVQFLLLRDQKNPKNWLSFPPNLYPLLKSHNPYQAMRQCLYCGQLFPPSKHNPIQKFCSDKCRVYYHRKKK